MANVTIAANVKRKASGFPTIVFTLIELLFVLVSFSVESIIYVTFPADSQFNHFDEFPFAAPDD